MRRLLMLVVGVIALASCGGNRSDENAGGNAVDTTGGEMVKAPDDSVRLEDTLSAPPPSDSVR